MTVVVVVVGKEKERMGEDGNIEGALGRGRSARFRLRSLIEFHLN